MRLHMPLLGACLIGAASFAINAARADVSIDEKTVLDLSLFKGSMSSSESFSADKKRRDSNFRCEGFMSFLCGNHSTAQIVRLDQGVTWELEPDKKRYREEPFMTPAQRKEMQTRLMANLEKAKQCNAQRPQAQSGLDTSKCQMSAQKFDSKNLGDDGQIIGHSVHRGRISMTQTCTDRDTGDVCDMTYAFDLWLTNDKIDGIQDREAFQKAYLAKMGFTGDSTAAMQIQVKQMLAPYSKEMGELQARAVEFKGVPLRSAMHIAYGGPKCGAAAKSQTETQSDTSAQDREAAARMLQSAGAKLAGLFGKKKKAEDAAPATPANTTAPSAALDADAPNTVRLVSFTTETTAIRPGSIAADQFEVPAGWTKVPPEPAKTAKDFTCDHSDSGK